MVNILYKPESRVAIVYLVIATLWILFSDGALLALGVNETVLSQLSLVKGLGFVLLTSLILYTYLHREFDRRFKLEDELQEQISQVKQSQIILAQSEDRFRKAIEESPYPIMLFAEDGEVLTVSKIWMELTGYTREQLSTLQSWTELAYGTGKQPVLNHIDTLFELTTRLDEGEFTIICADGTQRIWQFSSTPLDRLPDNRRLMMSIATDVTKLRQAEVYSLEHERLRARFQKEQERNIFVQRIISALSHDLRTPLTVILSSKDILDIYSDRMSEEKRHEKLDTIGRQVQFALELLDDTVNIARGNVSEVSYHPTPVNIATLCQVSVDETQTAAATQQRVKFANLNGLETAIIDEVLVSRILVNLLTNALKYSPDDSEVRLELEHTENWIVLRVIDRGIGIHEDEIPHIFDPFYRAKNAGSANGTGLGLCIVSDCVSRHGGQIRVESKLGEGSIFTVKLPFEEAKIVSAMTS